MQTLTPTQDLRKQNLHFNKICKKIHRHLHPVKATRTLFPQPSGRFYKPSNFWGMLASVALPDKWRRFHWCHYASQADFGNGFSLLFCCLCKCEGSDTTKSILQSLWWYSFVIIIAEFFGDFLKNCFWSSYLPWEFWAKSGARFWPICWKFGIPSTVVDVLSLQARKERK